MKKCSISVFLVSVLLSSLLSACGSKQDVVSESPIIFEENKDSTVVSVKPQIHEEKKDGKTTETEISVDYDDFNTNLFNWNYFDTLDVEKNQFYSPFSIAQALAFVANGAEADTETRNEIVETLGFESIDALNNYYRDIVNDLIANNEGDSYPKFMTSNLIAGNSGKVKGEIDKKFVDDISQYYFFDIVYDDFDKNMANVKKLIKDWVDRSTNGYISDYEAQFTPETVVDILNAVYFKGEWEYTFEPSWSGEVTKINGDKVNHDMMSDTFTLRYYEDDKYRGVVLPYKQNNGVYTSMYLILPLDGEDLNIGKEWSNEDAEYRKTFMESLGTASEMDVRILLPKISMDTDVISITDNLKSLGMRKVFTDESEVTRFYGDYSPLHIDEVYHKTKLDVNEEGTEAAAITEVIMKDNAVAFVEDKPVEFYCNIPFVFVIRDGKYGVDLFTGIINEF